jgi:phosphinothricin acetyltransferase
MASSLPVMIRAATDADLPRLTEIYNHYVRETPTTFDVEPFTVEQRREWFSHYGTSGRYRVLVADFEGEIVGYTTSSKFHPRAAYDTTVESTILSAPERIGSGLGAPLYEALFRELAQEDVHSVMALVVVPNVGSERLHERMGFRHVGTMRQVGRKFGRYWDVAYYQKML